MISVDDHILEPRDLWARELPASMRDRGPTRRARAGQARLQRRRTTASSATSPDGTVVRHLALRRPRARRPGSLHAPAGVPPTSSANVPAIYEDFRPGTYDQTARLADMDANHVEASINYPNTFPRFAGQGFAERADKELALACAADLQRLDDRRVVRR